MLSEIGLVLLLALINGFFALAEIAFVVARQSRLKQMAKSSRRAALALRLAQSPEQFLSTVQVGITLLGIIAGVATGASIGQHIGHGLRQLGWVSLSHYAIPLGMTLSVGLITFINIVIGELVPKRIALLAPEKLAVAVSVPMLIVARLAAPFVWVFNVTSNLLLKALHLQSHRQNHISEDEIRLLVSESAEQGVLDEDERIMVSRVLRLGDRSVGSVMTPRPRIAWLDTDATLEENLAVLRQTPYSRYPVYRGGEQEVLGVLEVKRLLESVARGDHPLQLFRSLAKPLYVPTTARALDLLEEFRDAETPLALAVDEYGDIEGLVALNDLLEAVVGAATQGTEEAPGGASIVRRSDGSFLLDGSLSTEDLRELLDISDLPDEDGQDYHTVAGMVMTVLRHIPAEGESFVWQGISFEVIDMDGARIDKVLAVPPPAQNHGE